MMGVSARVGGWLGMWVGRVSVWVKHGLTMHLWNILELCIENIDYVPVNISAHMQDLKLLVALVVGWVIGQVVRWVGGWVVI